jgi:hypothetical protein
LSSRISQHTELNVGKTNLPSIIDMGTLLEVATRQSWPDTESRFSDSSYRLALGQETIELGVVEFRILLFLASRPYHAFTVRSIAAAVGSQDHPLAEVRLPRFTRRKLVRQAAVAKVRKERVTFVR